MPITVLCPQGHAVAVDDPRRDHACPRCGAILSAVPILALPALPGSLAARPGPSRGRNEDEDEEVRPRKRRPRADDDEDDDEPPRKRKNDRVQAGAPRKRPVARAEPEDDEDEDDDDAVETRKLSRKQRQFAMVRLGLMFHIVKFWLMLVGLAFGIVTLPLVIFAVFVAGSLGASILLQVTWGFAITLAPLVGTVGSVMCAMAPPKSETRGTIIVSIIFDVLAPFLALFQLILWFAWGTSGDERLGQLQGYMLYARIVFTVVSWWLLQVYLRKLCWFMRESYLASESLNVIVHLLMATVVTPALFIGTVMVNVVFVGLLPTIMFLATLAWMLFFAVTFPYKQLRLLSDVRAKIWVKYLKPDDDD